MCTLFRNISARPIVLFSVHPLILMVYWSGGSFTVLVFSPLHIVNINLITLNLIGNLYTITIVCACQFLCQRDLLYIIWSTQKKLKPILLCQLNSLWQLIFFCSVCMQLLMYDTWIVHKLLNWKLVHSMCYKW